MYASSLFSISLIFFSAAVPSCRAKVVPATRKFEYPKFFRHPVRPLKRLKPSAAPYYFFPFCAVDYFANKHQRIGLIMLHCLVILVVLALTHIATSQTISVNTDSNAFLCKTEMDCSQFYTGTARQGEW